MSVLLDKPAVTTLADLDRLEAAAQGSAALSCALTLRFSGPYLAAKRAIEAGEIGQVVSSMAAAAAQVRTGASAGLVLRPRAERWGAAGPVHSRYRWGALAARLRAGECGGAARGCALYGVPHVRGPRRGLAAAGGRRVGLLRASWLTPDSAPYHGDCRMLIEGTDGSIEIRTTAEDSLHHRQGGRQRRLTDFEGPSLDTPTGGRAERAGARLRRRRAGRDGPGDFGGGRDCIAPVDVAGARRGGQWGVGHWSVGPAAAVIVRAIRPDL